MKTTYTFLITVLLSVICFAQNGINYKALIKDNSGNVVANDLIVVQFTILEGATNVYQETHTPTTDINGLIIVNIGEGTTSDVFADINWRADDHFLNVQVDTGSGLTDMGTTQFMAVPYALSAANLSGLEALDEGNGTGWRLIDTDPSYYNNIGDRAVDLSYGGDTGYDEGLGAYGTGSVALGQYTSAGNGSVAMGYQSTASGQYATAMGNVTTASGLFSTTAGFYTTASAAYSTAFGSSTIADDQNSLVLGVFNDNTVASNTLFQIGNGTASNNRTNAFVVDSDGIITAPSFDISEITDNKALITKEFADANYSGGGSGTSPTGLEALDEGNGIGWRLIGSDSNNFGNIGANAVDLSKSFESSSSFGATGGNAFASGWSVQASGLFSSAFGAYTLASGQYSNAFGYYASAQAYVSVALGVGNIGGGNALTWIETDPLFEIGNGNSAPSNALTVLKNGTITAPSFDISEIIDNKALITKEYLEANSSSATGLEAIDEGNGIGWRLVGRDPANYGNIGQFAVDLSFSSAPSSTLGATALYSTALGAFTTASGGSSTALGHSTIASGDFSIAMGYDAIASGGSTIAMGSGTRALADSSTAIGFNTIASGVRATAIGFECEATGFESTAFGIETTASGNLSTVMGYQTIADDDYSTVIGKYNDNTNSTTTLFQVGNGDSDSERSNAFTVYENGNIEMGFSTIASGLVSTAMGYQSEASGYGSTALGFNTVASADGSVALGSSTIAAENFSTSIGISTISDDLGSTVVGRYNDNTSSTSTLFQVGNGTSLGNRSNAFTVLRNGYTSVGTHNEEPTTDFQIYHDNVGTVNGFKLQNKGANDNWWRFYTLNSNGYLYLYSKTGGNTNAVGSFNSVSGAYTALSDRRVKDNFKELYFNWDGFMQLKPLTYFYKADENKQSNIGFIAQDVESIYPELVNYNQEDDLYQLNYSGFGVVAIKAIQELKKEVETLSEENAKLKAVIAKQEALEARLLALEKNTALPSKQELAKH